MPAKALSPEQKADAGRLKAAFKQWQADRRVAGLKFTQEEFAALAEMGQSAFNQYAGGIIPLNWLALLKFSRLLKVDPQTISPGIVAAQREMARQTLAELGATNVRHLPITGNPESGLVKTSDKKDRDYPSRRSSTKKKGPMK